jgi:hydrogenase maturation protease
VADRAGLLVIGIGNPARGDDGAGPLSARLLEARACPGIEVRVLRSPDPAALLALWTWRSHVTLVDAMVTGAPPGTIRRWTLDDADFPAEDRGTSTHGLGIAQAVALGRALERLPRHLELFGIEAGCVDHDRDVSAPVRAAAARVVALIALGAGAESADA